jgi:hypothetical protein
MKLTAITPSQNLDLFGPGDILVLFGELFQRGYANGLVERAQEKGMTVIRSTVGRRDESHQLRPLNPDESKPFLAPFINVPLECGFDMEADSNGQTPIERCKAIGLKEGINAKLDLDAIAESQENGRLRFRRQVQTWCKALASHLKPGKKVLIAHLMAGGVPRSKIVLSLMNRTFKGTGDRYLSSEAFWNSDLGKLCEQNFLEVTAESFNIVIEESAELRNIQEASNGFIHYSAYGYHGTQIFFNGQLQWCTYTPYLQGFAKKKLEEHAVQHWAKGIKCTVYNCPEILTNSSGIFPGVEIFLYTLLFEFRHRNIKNSFAQNLINQAAEGLIPSGLEKMHAIINSYLQDPIYIKSGSFEQWPSHSNKALMELMLGASDQLISLHKNPNHLITSQLSELVIRASGALMLDDITNPSDPVVWLGHDAVIRYFEKN